MKKSLVAAMFAVMMISLVGCGKAPEPRTVEPTEVVEVAEEVTEVAEVVEETTEVEETAEESVETEEPSSPYTYTDLSQTMYAQSTVNVRETPEQTGAKLGSLTTNQEVTVTGQCNETGWYRISYNGGEGFVSDSYLGSEKVAVKSTSSSTASQPTSQSQTEATQAPPASDTSQPKKQPGEVDTSNAVTTDQVLAPGETLTPDVQPGTTCGLCGEIVNNYDEYLAHLVNVHGLQYGN